MLSIPPTLLALAQNPPSPRPAAPEGFVGPMLATLVERVPAGPGWQFEVKHDGYRMIVRAENGKSRIWSGWGLNWTASFPSVVASLRSLGRSVMIDGEAVCQFEDGHSNFHALASDAGAPKRCFGPSTS